MGSSLALSVTECCPLAAEPTCTHGMAGPMRNGKDYRP
jgi:hypothetical protein